MNLEDSIPLPWQQNKWRELVNLFKQNPRGYSILIGGSKGLGKSLLAKEYINYILCKNPLQDKACKICASCNSFTKQVHPDYFAINNEGSIGIDEIRALNSFIKLSPSLGKVKCAIIFNAEKMTNAASNALLKTLEEPKGKSFIILVSSNQQLLSATILSRCLKITLNQVDNDMVNNWLQKNIPDLSFSNQIAKLTFGAPLEAIRWKDAQLFEQFQEIVHGLLTCALGEACPIALAAKWLNFNIQDTLYYIYMVLSDMLAISLIEDPVNVINDSNKGEFKDLVAKTDPSKLLALFDNWLKLKKEFILIPGKNVQLSLEAFLIDWRQSWE